MNEPTINQRIFGTFFDAFIIGLMALVLIYFPVQALHHGLDVNMPQWITSMQVSGMATYLLFFIYRAVCEYRGTPTLGRGTAGAFVMEFRSPRLPRLLAVVIRNSAILVGIIVYLGFAMFTDRENTTVDLGWIYIVLWVTMLTGRDARHVFDRLAGAYPVNYTEHVKRRGAAE